MREMVIRRIVTQLAFCALIFCHLKLKCGAISNWHGITEDQSSLRHLQMIKFVKYVLYTLHTNPELISSGDAQRVFNYLMNNVDMQIQSAASRNKPDYWLLRQGRTF